MLSGILGIIVLAFKPRPRQKPLRQHFITFLRINSTLVTFIAAVCTFVASSFATFHLTNILSPIADCRPVQILVDSSACTVCNTKKCSSNKVSNRLIFFSCVPPTVSFRRYICKYNCWRSKGRLRDTQWQLLQVHTLCNHMVVTHIALFFLNSLR